jgi:uncharacterized repeat protein (TIGR03833 family)
MLTIHTGGSSKPILWIKSSIRLLRAQVPESSISYEPTRAGMQLHQQRSKIKPGVQVHIVMKLHQSTGKLTVGIVKNILTNRSSHPHGIKVRLTDGKVGRVQSIIR